jgi:hypothetical protein
MSAPIPVAAQSKVWVCGSRFLGLWVRNLLGAWMSVSCECSVLSDRGLCVGLITRPEESYRVWCVWVWSWNLDNEETLSHEGLLRHWKYIYKCQQCPLSGTMGISSRSSMCRSTWQNHYAMIGFLSLKTLQTGWYRLWLVGCRMLTLSFQSQTKKQFLAYMGL